MNLKFPECNVKVKRFNIRELPKRKLHVKKKKRMNMKQQKHGCNVK